jgi:hypothetical protein
MTTISTFVLIGTILSHDDYFSTVSFNLNPATNGGPSIAVLPNDAIPCKIEIGKTIYVVKDEAREYPIITCKKTTETTHELRP